MTLGDYAFALKFRDTINQMTKNSMEAQRPRYQYATVMSIDRTNLTCMVRLPGETVDSMVNMGAIQPSTANQIVRIDGLPGDRYISDVIGAPFAGTSVTTPKLTIGTVTIEPNIGTGFNQSVGLQITDGSRNGYSGLRFVDEAMTFMVDGAGATGMYKDSGAWAWYFDVNGVLQTGTVLGSHVSGAVANANDANSLQGGWQLGTGGNSIAYHQANGYIFGNYINMTADGNNAQPAWIAGQNGDNYMRWYNPGYLTAGGANYATSAGSAAGNGYGTVERIVTGSAYSVYCPNHLGSSAAYACWSSGGELGIFGSSRRFKEDIEEWNGEAPDILDLQPVMFTMKDDPGAGRILGLIAEEVVEVFPEAAVYINDELQDYSERGMLVAVLTILRDFRNRLNKLEEAA